MALRIWGHSVFKELLTPKPLRGILLVGFGVVLGLSGLAL